MLLAADADGRPQMTKLERLIMMLPIPLRNAVAALDTLRTLALNIQVNWSPLCGLLLFREGQ